MKVFVTQFSFDGSEREQFARVHHTRLGALEFAKQQIEQSKVELMEGLNENDLDYEQNCLTIQGPTTLDDGTTIVQLINGIGTEVECWSITETEVGE